MSRNSTNPLPQYVSPAGAGCWLLEVWAQPGAKKSELAGTYQGRLKVRVQAPAVDNKANRALTDFFAGVLGLRKSQINLRSGHASRSKTLEISSQVEPDWTVVAS